MSENPNIEAHRQALKDSSMEVRIRAARELAALREDAHDAYLDLCHRYAEADTPEEEKAMVAALRAINPVLMAISERHYAKELRRDVNQEAAQGLTIDEARKTIGNLIWSFGAAEPSADDLTEQGEYLVEIALVQPALIPNLIDLMETNSRLRGQLSCVLMHIAYKLPRKVGPAMVPLLAHRNPRVVDAAANVIAEAGSVGPLIEQAIPALIARVSELSYDPAQPAARALSGLGSGVHTAEVVAALVGQITSMPDDADHDAYYRWVDVLARLTLHEDAAREALTELRRHSRPAIRAWAVGVLDHDNPEALIAILHEAMQDDDARVRRCAMRGASRWVRESIWVSVHQPPPELASIFVAALDDPDDEAQQQAAKGLRRLRARLAREADDAKRNCGLIAAIETITKEMEDTPPADDNEGDEGGDAE